MPPLIITAPRNVIILVSKHGTLFFLSFFQFAEALWVCSPGVFALSVYSKSALLGRGIEEVLKQPPSKGENKVVGAPLPYVGRELINASFLHNNWIQITWY